MKINKKVISSLLVGIISTSMLVGCNSISEEELKEIRTVKYEEYYDAGYEEVALILEDETTGYIEEYSSEILLRDSNVFKRLVDEKLKLDIINTTEDETNAKKGIDYTIGMLSKMQFYIEDRIDDFDSTLKYVELDNIETTNIRKAKEIYEEYYNIIKQCQEEFDGHGMSSKMIKKINDLNEEIVNTWI